MNKLLRADMARLFKGKIFLLEVLIMFLAPVWAVISNLVDSRRYDYIASTEGSLFASAVFAAFCMVVLVPAFIGTEYNDKTIRNKMIVGHGKGKIFLSNMVTMLAASAILVTAWNISHLTLGAIFLGFCYPFELNLLILLAVYISVFASTALFVLISMFVSSKYGAAIVTTGIFFFLLVYSLGVMERLAAQPTITAFYSESNTDMDIYGYETDMTEEELAELKTNFIEETIPNPNYIEEGTFKEILKISVYCNPAAQAIDLPSDHSIGFEWYFIYDIILIAVLSFLGAVIYKRKEIN